MADPGELSEVQQRNIDLVIAWLDAWEQGPEYAVARIEEFLHPEFEWKPGGVAFGREVHRGHAEIREYMETTAATTSTVSITRQEVRAIGEDRVLVLGRLRYVGRDQEEDPALNGEYGLVLDIEGDRIRSSESFLSHRAAEAAAGTGRDA